MEDIVVPVIVVGILFLGLPWIIFHYITKWKTSATLTSEDEHLLEDLYQMARRLDDRMDTVERIIKSDNPDWNDNRLGHSSEQDDQSLAHIDRMLKERNKI
jgi:phage shock protein B